ncbi:hypothetical protein GQ53DRAFT_823737 [Thozetella sp. PMI_491]|nr:hypothetical protein GQ53DRAFT_823737 [Thozetella sp. PMI_491]
MGGLPSWLAEDKNFCGAVVWGIDYDPGDSAHMLSPARFAQTEQPLRCRVYTKMYNSLRRTFHKARTDDPEPNDPVPQISRHVAADQSSILSSYTIRRHSELAQYALGPSLNSPPPVSLLSGRSRSQDRRNEPLGLHVVYEPPQPRTVDIIFVHGLGGTSRLSWSWNRDLAFFWPQEWLPLEPGFEDARIMTFGYNAHFMSQTKDTFNISDFAKDLLLQLKFGNDSSVNSLNLGQVPIIFVVHSMGGLVVKKAYILGSQDHQFSHILDTVCSIVFLATPHRGSNLAEILNKFLSVSFQSTKQYVSDLQKNSARIMDINDQFKLHANKMQLVSFFETQATTVGLKKIIVVERDSALLDYPNEISSALNADHHSVCKYKSREDANYVTVRNVIKSLVDKFKVKAVPKRRRSIDQGSYRSFTSVVEIMGRLGVAQRPSDTLGSLLEQLVPGSCDWILSDSVFTSFMNDDSSQPTVLHITGRPGSGKSVLASFLIQHLEEQELPVQFWFFRHDDQLKRSNRQCLLSLAFQVVSSFPEYSHRLLSLARDINSIARSDIRSLWQNLFLNLLNKLSGYDPLYWVIDALDESESAQAFLGLFSLLKNVQFPLRIIFLTRSQTITKHYDRLRTALPPGRTSQISMSTPDESLQLYITERLEFTPWPKDLKESISASLLKKSQGSFLWLSLVMRELVSCDTVEQLEEVLEETPWELLDIYARLENGITRDLRPSDTPLLNAIMSWVTCSDRPLTEDELTEALKPQFSILNLKHTASRLCGDFVVIDKKSVVSMVHYTAKEYLLRSATTVMGVNSGAANTFIFKKCLAILVDPRFRMRLKSQGCTGLLRYCCLSWFQHMVRSDEEGHHNDYLRSLTTFFQSTACLAWIEAVATTGQLQVLSQTAKALSTYLDHTRRLNSEDSPLAQPIMEIEYLSTWSTELVRVVGKFGTHILQYPSCIYSLVPIFCPPASTISQMFAATGPDAPRITGVSNTGWDDSLAKFTLGQGQKPKSIFCLHSSFGVVTSTKCVNLYSASTFQETARFPHNELLVATALNQEGDMLVTCGVKTIKVWDLASARTLHVFSNPKGMRAMAISFSRDSSEIVVICVDSKLRRQLLTEPEDWLQVEWQAQNEPSLGRGGGTPVCAAFSPDGSQVVVSHRTSPMTVWDTETGNRVGRSEGRAGRKFNINDNVDYPVKLVWNPATDHVIGIFLTGSIFKWYPLDSQHEEMENSPLATEIACSPDGRLIVTGQRDGSLKIFSFDGFSLLYNLTGMNRASDLAISPDGRRIYDIRQSFCNVWEPNALTRMAEQDDRSSDAASSHFDVASVTASLASEATANVLEPVATVCSATSTTAFAFGNDGGVVKYVPSGNRGVTEIHGSIMGVTSIGIRDNGQALAIATMDRKITLRLIGSTGEVEPEPLFEAKSENTVLQILFDDPGQHLLVRCQDTVGLWSISSKSLLASVPTADETFHWTLHPSNEGEVIAVNATRLVCHQVLDLAVTRQWSIDTTEVETSTSEFPWDIKVHAPSDSAASTQAGRFVEKVLPSPNRTCLLIQTSASSDSAQEHRDTQIMLLDLAFLASTAKAEAPGLEGPPLLARALPASISATVEIPLGFVVDATETRRGSRDAFTSGVPLPGAGSLSLAFIDRDFWVRTWRLDDQDGTGCQKHFFLPRDWVNMECLKLAHVTPDGRFLCPKNGEVAVVHNGLRGLGEIEDSR